MIIPLFPFVLVVLAALAATFAAVFESSWWWFAAAPLDLLALIGIWDFFQRKHTLLRVFPLAAHLRWFFEWLRPFLRGYIVESETEGQPFNIEDRALVYRRAKDVQSVEPFGSQLDFQRPTFEWLTHSVNAKHISPDGFRTQVGGPDCTQPYSASVFNISAMSSARSVRTPWRRSIAAAAKGGFYHDTGEGGVSRYHRAGGGDLVWEIGSGYFGCRGPDCTFDPARFKDMAALDQIKMIEIKISQGAKPGGGGILLAEKSPLNR